MVQVHSLKDVQGNDDDEDGRAAANEMPVDGERLSSDFYGLYHEKQIGALCAVHALNNLMQERRFDEVELASIAHDLDEKERAALGGSRLKGEEASGNVRADGFFSSQVVLEAVRRAGLRCGATSTDATSESYVASFSSAAQTEKAFIFNRREHWFALRKIGTCWFDLNSTFAAPKHLLNMSAFLTQQRDAGYSIFVVRGSFPALPLESDASALRRAARACEEAGPGSSASSSKTATTNATDFQAFKGSGSRLAGEKGSCLDPSLLLAAQRDPELAAAIAASLDHQDALPRDAKQDADEIRRKRLARFGGSPAQRPRNN